MKISALDRRAILQAAVAGATIVTPNRRLARALKAEHDTSQVEQGRRAWRAADILPMDAWLARSVADAGGPVVLSQWQERALWQSIILDTPEFQGVVRTTPVVLGAMQAWSIALTHGIWPDVVRQAEVTPEVGALVGWARRVTDWLDRRGVMARAQVPAWLASQVAQGRWRPAGGVMFAAFRAHPGAVASLRARLDEAGVCLGDAWDTEPRPPRVAARVAFPDERAQWSAVAAWARGKLDRDPEARIGIVVPDLEADRRALEVALSDALSPHLVALPDQAAARPFDFSLGARLADYPVVDAALTIFEAASQQRALETAGISRLVMSPFLGDAESELAARARLDRSIRERGIAAADLAGLARVAGRINEDGSPHPDSAPLLAQRLRQAMSRTEAAGRKETFSRWVGLMFSMLDDLGYPGQRPLDRSEASAYRRFVDLVKTMASLDAVVGPTDFRGAVSELRGVAKEIVFQPEGLTSQVAVLGVLESVGQAFDALWVTQMTSDAWPLAPTPNAFLPMSLQKQHGIPQSTPAVSLADASAVQAGWMGASPEVVFSWPEKKADRELRVSQLIAPVRQMPVEHILPKRGTQATELIQQQSEGRAVERLADARAPAHNPGRAAGGSWVLADQAVCGFRALATHRLGAKPLKQPTPGIDPASRGRLLHGALEAFWRDVRTQSRLLGMTPEEVGALVGACCERAVAHAEERRGPLPPKFRQLEMNRLNRTVHAWLDVERRRPPFEVSSVEAPDLAQVGPLEIEVRPDRIDRLESGGEVVIDYKSGEVSVNSWMSDRPQNPQVPLYATTRPNVVGAAIGSLKPGSLGLAGVAAHDEVFQAARVIDPSDAALIRPGWDGLLEDWREALKALAEEYASGQAEVTPSTSGCTNCKLPSVCRKEERLRRAP